MLSAVLLVGITGSGVVESTALRPVASDGCDVVDFVGFSSDIVALMNRIIIGNHVLTSVLVDPFVVVVVASALLCVETAVDGDVIIDEFSSSLSMLKRTFFGDGFGMLGN